MKAIEFKNIKTGGRQWIDQYIYLETQPDQSEVYEIHTIFYDGDKEVCRLIDKTCINYSDALDKFGVIGQGLSVLKESE